MSKVYNPPPTWPPPPQGWAPTPGWQPDPSWPDPPADWEFWIEEPTPGFGQPPPFGSPPFGPPPPFGSPPPGQPPPFGSPPPGQPAPFGQPPPFGSPPFGPPPAFGPPPFTAPYSSGSSPKRKQRWWLVIGIPVVAGLLLLGTGITAVVYTIEHSIQPAKKAATAYIGALQAGRYADAYEMQCAEDQTGKNAFVLRWSRQLAAGHNISSFTVHGVSLSNVNGRSEAEVGIDVIYEDGTHSSTVLPLIKKASKWQPCP